MFNSRAVWVAVAFVMCWGCTAVRSEAPVGERAKVLSQADWEGTWIHKDHAVTIKVGEQRPGLLRAAWVEERAGGVVLESYQVEMREAGEWLIGNVKAKEGPASYYWGLVKKEEGQFIVWYPDAAQFARLIQAGLLPGRVEKGGDVVLGTLTPEHLTGILSGERGVCFDWKSPVVFFRVGK